MLIQQAVNQVLYYQLSLGTCWHIEINLFQGVFESGNTYPVYCNQAVIERTANETTEERSRLPLNVSTHNHYFQCFR